MSLRPGPAGVREHRLRALGVEPWRLRREDADAPVDSTALDTAPPDSAPALVDAGTTAASPVGIRKLALQPDPAELRDPAIHTMYVALTEAVAKAGLQAVRVCDVAGDPAAAVLVFGGAPPPAGVPAVRVLRADPLAVLGADRERKRILWERLLALGRMESRRVESQ